MSSSSNKQNNQSTKAIGRAIFWPVFLLAIVVFAVYASQRYGATRPTVAFITADSTPYWDRVIEGAREAAEAYDVDLRVIRADGTLENQNARISEVMARPIDAVAISPVNAERQTGTLRGVAGSTVLITVDSDCEMSDRVCFVGMDNYNAGRSAAELVRSALPNGGRVLIVAGPLDKVNGQERRQGLIDSLVGRESRSALNADAIDQPTTGGKFTIPTTLIDELNPEQATAQIAEAMNAGEQFDAIVGLYGYHATAIAAAVDQSGATDIKVIGFDALPETLDAIEQGRVFGIIAQDQRGYGFQSVRTAAEAAAGFDIAPLTRQLTIPPVLVTLNTLDQARIDMGLAKMP